jgi:hypothetical protein
VRPATILALAIASFGLLPLACTQDFNFFAATQGTGGGQTSSGSGATPGSSSGSPTGCQSAADCNDMNPCTTDTCNQGSGTCSHAPVADGSPPIGYTDTVKDCKTDQCMSGMVQAVADDSDVPASGNPCVTNSCANAVVVMTNVMSGQSCGTNQMCDGMGTCVGCTTKSDCMTPGACQSVACTNRKCVISNDPTGTACTAGGGKVCSATGTCVACNTGADCASGTCTNNMCTLAANGSPCTSAAQCTNGHCASGFCCDTDCTANCMACAKSFTGTMNGKCALVTAGTTAPAGQCTASPPCGNTGKCAGFGVCQVAPTSTACGDQTCTNGTETPAGTCDGMGKCQQTPVSCNGYACSGTACGTTCSGPTQCEQPAYTCDANNHCLFSAGQPCTMGTQCASGTCALPDGGTPDAGGMMVCQ